MLNNKLYKTINKYCANIDIPYQIDFVKRYAEIGDSKLYGGKHCGSSAEQAGAIEIEKQLKKLGLSNVKRVPVDTGYYQFNDATLKLINSDIEIKPYGYVSPGTEECGIEAEIVDVNKATKSDFKNRDVKGKIVLFAAMGSLDGGNLAGQMEEALLNEVAAMIIYAVEDVLDDETIRVQPPNIISTVPIVGICRKDAQIIKEMSSNNSCIGNLWVDAQFSPAGGTTYNVIGEIPGKLSEEKIIYTAHLDHYFRCLQDNISTCATLLGTAKAMIDSGYQPNRSIVFLFHGSHETGLMDSRYPYIYGSYKMAKLYESEFREKAIANLNFEYTALSQHCLQGLAYLCCNNIYKNYFPYSPELVGGFKIKNNSSPQSEYYIMSWADNISYLNIGVPSYLNDAITEQLYTGTSLYVGRDHSNKDNWEVFDEKTLEDVARFYGGLAIYIDALPFIDLDFT